MAIIKVLPKQVSELIAAGEVVERPSSVIKELVENSIDAHSTKITVEIQNGGVTYMRVTDNGCGIARDDVTTAFLRHATSKINKETDLDEIATLGFRGEALAAISSVSRIELLTKTKTEEVGTSYFCEGGQGVSLEDAGCPQGTTIIVRDLFFNTPARMKFLKKDVAEGNAVSSVIYNIALSHPEISVNFIRDGKQILTTAGDGDLYTTVYSVCGRDFAAGLIPVESELNGISVKGYVSKPNFCRPKKNAQFVFLNGRYVRSGTVSAALEQAYKNSAMVGRFPAAILHLTVPYGAVDINVHPAKTEVRFSDEKRIFDCVYYGVVNAISKKDTRPEVDLKKTARPFNSMTAAEYIQTTLKEAVKEAVSNHPPTSFVKADKVDSVKAYEKIISQSVSHNVGNMKFNDSKPTPKPQTATGGYWQEKSQEKPIIPPKPEVVAEVKTTETPEIIEVKEETIESVKETVYIEYIGEAFSTYIIAQKGDSIFLIDKHAAHERIIFNRLKSERKQTPQMLLLPETVVLQPADYTAIVENIDILTDYGFEVDDFGDNTVIVRAIPSILSGENVEALIFEVADGLATKHKVETEKEERLFETMACRAAVKAGNGSTDQDLKHLAQQVLSDESIMYCPHGRPVAIELTKKNIEKQFGRIQ